MLDLLRFQLTYNIYPFHDARLRSAARPKLAAAADAALAAAEEADGGGGAKRKQAKRSKAAPGIRYGLGLGPCPVLLGLAP